MTGLPLAPPAPQSPGGEPVPAIPGEPAGAAESQEEELIRQGSAGG